MTFIAPWAGAVALALGTPVLLALYLLRLRRRALRVGSTMLWERAVQDLQVNVPLRWLRMSLPLVLQALALASVAMALARPVFNPLSAGAGRVVLLIDRSAVMSAADGLLGAPDTPTRITPTRLDEAKRRAIDTLESLRRAGTPPEVMVVQFAHSAQVLAAWTSDLPTLREAVDSITPSDQPADLGAALKVLEPFATAASPSLVGRTSSPPASAPPPDESSPSPLSAQAPPPEVLVFSCGLAPPPMPDASRLTPLATRLIRVGPAMLAPRRNLGIVALSARRENDDPATLRLFIRIANAAAQAEETTLRISFAGRTPEIVPLTVPGAAGNTPGEATATLAINETAGGTLVCELPGGDTLASDDSAALVVSAATRPRVLVVGPGGPSTSGATKQGIDPFLLSALTATEPAALDTTDALGIERLIASGRLATLFDLVVLDRVRIETPMPAGVATLSVACVPKLTGIEWSLNERDGAPTTRCLAWERKHPVLRHAPLDGLYVSPALRLTARSIGAAKVDTLAEGEAGPLIAAIGSGPAAAPASGTRHMLICFELARSNWGPDASFPVFIASAADWLTGRAEAQAGRSFTTTEAISLVPEPGAHDVRLQRIGARSASATSIAAPVQPAMNDAGDAAASVSIGPVERAGVYRAVGVKAGGLGDTVAVNLLDPWASVLGTSDTLAGASTSGSLTTGRGGPKEVWHWFLVAALAISTIEWFVYAWRMRG